MVYEALLLQPFSSMPVTEYVVVATGCTLRLLSEV